MVSAQQLVRRHVDAFNAGDLDALMDTFHPEAVWRTGTDVIEGRVALESFFGSAIRALRPRLEGENGLLRRDWLAGGRRADRGRDDRRGRSSVRHRRHLPSRGGVIRSGTIYREGSAGV